VLNALNSPNSDTKGSHESRMKCFKVANIIFKAVDPYSVVFSEVQAK